MKMLVVFALFFTFCAHTEDSIHPQELEELRELAILSEGVRPSDDRELIVQKWEEFKSLNKSVQKYYQVKTDRLERHEMMRRTKRDSLGHKRLYGESCAQFFSRDKKLYDMIENDLARTNSDKTKVQLISRIRLKIAHSFSEALNDFVVNDAEGGLKYDKRIPCLKESREAWKRDYQKRSDVLKEFLVLKYGVRSLESLWDDQLELSQSVQKEMKRKKLMLIPEMITTIVLSELAIF